MPAKRFKMTVGIIFSDVSHEMKRKTSYYVINLITAYRVVAAPFLVILVLNGNIDLFKWLLPVSFFTDLIDGYLARKFRVTSTFGTRLDSIGDDLTIIAGAVGVFVVNPEFVFANLALILTVLILLVAQNILAFVKYRKTSSFHTYFAKLAALLQGTFLILFFLLPEPVYILFYVASAVSIIDLLEEIVLVLLLPKWEANVKGLFWILKRKKLNNAHHY